ncbi:aromatic acid exporter family protein [Nonomuraea recticatena]|uniref:aromatic acid exporter family protein n=1 Tax=Nonomuraea recticatena TaxID=46178 RepID=UPI00361297A0
MRHPESSRLSAAVRQELAYVRTQLKALGERGSHQRFELRQIAKATLAAVLAWLLADRFLPRETLWIAPATAVIMVHATVYKTLTNGLRKVAAVAAGVIRAGSIGHLLGLTAFTLVLVVPLPSSRPAGTGWAATAPTWPPPPCSCSPSAPPPRSATCWPT